MKVREGIPKYRVLCGSFALLFGIFSYLRFRELSLLALASFMASWLAGMITERREYEAKNPKKGVDGPSSAPPAP
jgi:hypothetical protein